MHKLRTAFAATVLTVTLTGAVVEGLKRWADHARLHLERRKMISELRVQKYPATANKCILVTAFGPFDDWLINPSWECVKHLQGCIIREHRVVCVQLPVEYEEVARQLPELLEQHRPKLALLCGVGPPACLHLETLAHNLTYTRRDVSDALPPEGKASQDGSDELLSVLPIRHMVCTLRKRGHNVIQSIDPGRFLCDFAMYTALHANRCPATFLHIPPVDEGVEVEEVVSFMYDVASMSLDFINSKFKAGHPSDD